jgi:hypothetical protein
MKFPFWSRALCISENQPFCSRFVSFDGRAKRFLRAPELFIRDSRVLCRAPHLTAISAFSCDVHCYFSPDVSLTALEKSLPHSQFPKISQNLKIELPATMSVSPSNFSQLPKSLLTNDIRAFRSRGFLKFFARANSKNRRFFSKQPEKIFRFMHHDVWSAEIFRPSFFLLIGSRQHPIKAARWVAAENL